MKDTLSAYKEQTDLPQEQIDASIKVLEDTLASASGQCHKTQKKHVIKLLKVKLIQTTRLMDLDSLMKTRLNLKKPI